MPWTCCRWSNCCADEATLVYPGTELYQRLQRNALLLGGQLSADYRVLDKTASRFRALLHQLWASLPDWVPLASDAHEIATLQSFARRLELPAYDEARAARLARTIAELNAFRIDALKRVLGIAELELDAARRQLALTSLVRSLRPGVAARQRSLGLLRRRLEQDDALHELPRRSFVRTTYAASLLVLNAACGGIARDVHHDSDTTGTSAGAGGVPAQEIRAGAPGAAERSPTGGAGPASAGVGGASAAGGVAADVGEPSKGGRGSTAGTAGANGAAACTADDVTTEVSRMQKRAEEACKSDPEANPFHSPYAISYTVHVDEEGTIKALDLGCLGGPEYFDVRDCVVAALSKETFPCIPDGYAWGNVCVQLAL